MRDDMNKVVIERPRYGGKGGQRRTYERVSMITSSVSYCVKIQRPKVF